jgi:hypothetical protein
MAILMTKALVSFGTGPASAMRQLTLPRMMLYGARHGYTPHFNHEPTLEPPSWGKVPILRKLLLTHDAVLWLDADCLIVDPLEDLAAHVPASAAHALVSHQTGEGVIPNCGVWYLTQAAAPLLDEVMGLYAKHWDHCWWEQAAVIERINDGWRSRTFFLDPGWNRHPQDHQLTDRVRIEHYTAMPDRFGSLLRRVEALSA